MIVRRVVEARQLHHQQQISQGNVGGEGSGHPLSHLSHFGFGAETHPISHSRTPPLTAHERAIGQKTEDSQPQKRQGPQWLSMGRALSRKLTRSRNTVAAPVDTEKASHAKNNVQQERASYDQGKLEASSSKSPTVTRQYLANSDEMHTPGKKAPHNQQDVEAEAVYQPWRRRKRRILCL